jgi:hypothetical protein
MIDLEGCRPEEIRIIRVYKITNGTAEHGCCACHAAIMRRKMKLLADVGGRTKQFFLCVQCYASPPPELKPSLTNWQPWVFR